MLQGKINRGRHTVWLGATPSRLISAHLNQTPTFTDRRPFLPPNQQCQSTIVGDERCSPAGILFVMVRANHPAASPIALAESSGAHRLQARSPCVQVPSRSSTAVPRRRTQPASQPERASVPPRRHRCLFGVRGCQLSATGPFQSPQPVFGTVCRSTSRLHRFFPPSEAG